MNHGVCPNSLSFRCFHLLDSQLNPSKELGVCHKSYIFNLVPSKRILPESTVASVAIDHQMVVIQVQVGKNFIEDVLLDSGYGINIIT